MFKNNFLFVFTKPIERTDISKGELISLIELQKSDAVIRVESYDIYESKFLEPNGIDTDEEDFTYIFFLSQSAIVTSNFDFDIEEIIRRSGYIHSCGKFIFSTKWADLSIQKIEEEVVAFCTKEKYWHKTVFYKASENRIKSKLEALLIDDSRYHIKNQSFHFAADSLETNLNQRQGKLKLPYKSEHIFIILEKLKVNDNTMLSGLYEGRDIVDYSVCYLSEYKKDNPIHEMDDLKELKPFWAGIFTTPHRLMNAMLNIAKVDENSTILDPFCHTGTLVIEASQIGCNIIACDLMGANGAKDNYDFFCKGAENFLTLVEEINSHIIDKKLNAKFKKIIENNTYTNNQGLPETKGDINGSISSLSQRLYFYIIRRYNMEHMRGAELSVDNYKDFVKKYIDGSITDDKIPGYKLFSKQFSSFEKAFHNSGIPVVNLDGENVNFFIDSYYKSKRVGYINKCKVYPTFQKNDICKNDNYNIPESSLDAVVTDPPYGYGEGLSVAEVKLIYTSLIEKSIKWLKPKGYIVFCALDKVKTGRTENLLFTEKVIEIVNVVAKRNNVKFVMNDVLLTTSHLKNVYYWKSNYALNRSIISLQILK